MSSGWAVLANGVSLIVTSTSPHGLAAFTYAGYFLGIIGLVVQLLHMVGFALNCFRFSVRLNGLIGLVSGFLSFLTAAWFQDAKSLLPIDLFGVALFSYLCLLGAAIGALNTFAISKLQATSGSDPAN